MNRITEGVVLKNVNNIYILPVGGIKKPPEI